MNARLNTFVTLAGLLVEVGSYLGLLMGIFQDPFYLFLTLVFGILTLTWVLLFSCGQIEVRGQTVDSSGHAQLMTRPKTPMRRKMGVAGALLLASGWLVFVIISEGSRIFDPAIVSTPVTFGRASHKFVDVHGHEGFAKGIGDLVHSGIQTTHVVDVEQLSGRAIRNLMVEGDGYLFTVAKRPRVPWIQLDEIRVIVEKHWKDNVPRVVSETRDSSRQWQSCIFIAELEPPNEGEKQKACLAKCLYPEHTIFSGGEPLPINQIPVISEQSPFPILLLLTAREPGLYQYRVELTVSCLGKTSRLDVARPALCLVSGPLPEEQVDSYFRIRPSTVLPGPGPVLPVQKESERAP